MEVRTVKNGIGVFLFSMLLLFCWPAFSAGAVSDPVAYYPFSGNADDASGNGYNATVSGATLTTDRNGAADSAYLFNGSSSAISASVGSAFSFSSLTLAAWIKVSGPGDNNPRIVAVGPAGSPFQHYSLILEGTGSSRRLWLYTSEAISNAYSTFKIDSDNAWHFVAVTYDAGSVKFYLDGSYMDQTSVTGALESFSSAVLQIGYSANGLDRFSGALDEIRIFSRALTDAEIKSLYDQDTAFGITSETDPAVLIPGTNFDWSYQITPGTDGGEAVDLVAAVAFPDQSLLFFSDQGITNQFLPYIRGLSVGEGGYGGFILPGLSFPGALPEGYYNFYTLLVRSGNIITDANNWVSKPAVSQVYYSALSPAQQGLIGESGYPNRFIKSFSEEDRGKRVDETWAYATEGKIRSYINGEYAGQTDTSVEAAAPPNSARPQDYTFATTPNAVISKHGQPAAVQTKTVWSGTFTHYIYDTLAFGFLNNALVSVISVGAASSTNNYETNQTPMYKCSDSTEVLGRKIDAFTASMRNFRNATTAEIKLFSSALHTREATGAAASETVNTGVLFTYASLLGLAAQEGVQGAQSAWDSCMAGISSSAPTETNLNCFKDALSTLSVQSAEHVMEANDLSDWANWLSSLWSDTQSNESTAREDFVGSPGQNPGQTGYASLSVAPGEAKAGDTVQLTFQAAEKILGQPLSYVQLEGDSGYSAKMNKAGEGIYTLNVTVSTTGDRDGEHFTAGAVYGNGSSTVYSYCTLGFISTPSIKINNGSPNTQGWGLPISLPFVATVSGGKSPYIFNWNVAGEARSFGPTKSRDSWEKKTFDSTGTFPVSVTVTDDAGQSATASISAVVKAPKLTAAFSAQPSKLKTGEAGQFCVSASGGSPPYIYTFASSDGFSQAGTNACASLTFAKWGSKTVSVEVEDTASNFQSVTIACKVLVTGSGCDPATQIACGGYCCSKDKSCCGGAACCNAAVDCCYEKIGIAGCCAGGNCCEDGRCCRPDEQCCGGGCCKPGSYCSGGTCVPY